MIFLNTWVVAVSVIIHYKNFISIHGDKKK